MRKRTLLPFIVVLLFVALALPAQSLMDDPQYRQLVEEARSLEQQAAAAIDEGEYDRAIELSNQATEVAEEADAYAEQRISAFRARGLLTMVGNRIEVVRSFNGAERYPRRWETANEQYRLAQNQFSSSRYQESISASRAALSALQGIAPAQQALDEAQAPPELPRYYVVRLIPDRRDSFWRIAGYDFVYGDPWKWRLLYEANKDVIQDPDNPRLIQPGQRFRIPSIEGEQRAGVWNEQQNN